MALSTLLRKVHTLTIALQKKVQVTSRANLFGRTAVQVQPGAELLVFHIRMAEVRSVPPDSTDKQ
jgi:hypothetical protein